MILHSIVPLEQIFPSDGGLEYSYRKAHNSYIQGVKSAGRFTVSRLISTDPRLYLDPHYTPGAQMPPKNRQ